MANALAQLEIGDWMPKQASTFAGDVDWVFMFILGISAFFFLLIVVLMIVFVIKYRQREGHTEQPSPHSSLALELTWTIIPTILVFFIFGFGFRTYMDIATPPANAYEILVTAYKWDWAFTYPNGHVDENLHVPANRPVRVVLTSKDVIHSMYIPVFRLKRDAVPGRFNRAWFEATEVNVDEGYDLFCAEYCGTQHADMMARVYVHEPTDFKRWLEDASNWEKRMSPAQRGEQLYTARGCNQCHSIDGSRVIGPSFKELWDRTAAGTTTFRDGTKLADLLDTNYSAEDYLRQSILEPSEHVVAGYDDAMASYQGSLKDNDILAIIAYLKTLSDSYSPELDAEADTQTAPATRDATNAQDDQQNAEGS